MGKKRRSREFKNNSKVIDIEEARKARLQKKQAEKDKAEEKVRYAASQRTRGKMAIRKNRLKRRVTVGIICLALILIVAWSLMGILNLIKEQQDIKKQQEELKKEKAQLEKELDEINNRENIEQQARDQLKLIKKGEKLFVFPSELTENQEDEETDSEE